MLVRKPMFVTCIITYVQFKGELNLDVFFRNALAFFLKVALDSKKVMLGCKSHFF